MVRPAASSLPVGRAARGVRLASLLAELALRPARGADRIAAGLAELRGAALKLGQLASLVGDGLLPAELSEALALLRDQACCMDFPVVQGILRRELGRVRLADLASIEPEPLAAASLGQVHAARARDGRDLVLKIQYPGVERSIASDVGLAALLLQEADVPLRAHQLGPLLARLGQELRRETDYRQEARSMRGYRGWLADAAEFEVPQVHADLSTRRVLASERIRGLPLEDLRGAEHPASLRDRLGSALLGLALRELCESKRVQTDPNFANYLFVPGTGRIALLDFGSTLQLGRVLAAAYRALVCATVEGDDGDLLAAAIRLGLLRGDEPRSAHEAWLRLARSAAEPLRARGRYDFAGSDLGARVRELGVAAYRDGELPLPPVEVLLLQRKLAGTFLLLRHIGARADAGAAYRRHVRDAAGRSDP